MSLHIVIDGYNLLGFDKGYFKDLEEERNSLIKDLTAYKRVKRVKVTVVFDGTASGRLQRGKEVVSGIEVVFSKNGEDADSILKELARATGQNLTLVTSDRDVASYASDKGAVVISAGEFRELLDMALYEDLKGVKPEDEDDYPIGKKGPSKRPTKNERRKIGRLKKL